MKVKFLDCSCLWVHIVTSTKGCTELHTAAHKDQCNLTWPKAHCRETTGQAPSPQPQMIGITVIILEAKDYCVKRPDVTLLTAFKAVPCLRLFEYSQCHSMLSPTVMLCQPHITTIMLGDVSFWFLFQVSNFGVVSLPHSWVGDSTDSQQKTGWSRLLQSSSHGEHEELCKSGCFELVSLLFGENQLKLVFPSGSSPQRETHRRGVFSLWQWLHWIRGNIV